MHQIRYNGYQDWNTALLTITAGATFTPLPSIPCDEIVIYNPSSGTTLDVINTKNLGGTPDLTQFVTLDAPSGAVIPVAGTASEIGVRRTDLASTSTSVRYIWRKYRR